MRYFPNSAWGNKSDDEEPLPPPALPIAPIWLNRRTAHYRSHCWFRRLSSPCLLPPQAATGLRNLLLDSSTRPISLHLAQSARCCTAACIACFASLLHPSHIRHRQARGYGATGGGRVPSPFALLVSPACSALPIAPTGGGYGYGATGGGFGFGATGGAQLRNPCYRLLCISSF